LRRYQLYLASARTQVLWIHVAKKRNFFKKNSHYSDYFLAEAVPKTAPEIQFLQKMVPLRRKQCPSAVIAWS
jgi:hypothetical protein